MRKIIALIAIFPSLSFAYTVSCDGNTEVNRFPVAINYAEVNKVYRVSSIGVDPLIEVYISEAGLEQGPKRLLKSAVGLSAVIPYLNIRVTHMNEKPLLVRARAGEGAYTEIEIGNEKISCHAD